MTSQLYFDPALIEEIFGVHPDYAEFGQPDTSNETDSIYMEEGLVEAERMPDGALLAWKALVLRSSLSDPLCGSSGGPPPGG